MAKLKKVGVGYLLHYLSSQGDCDSSHHSYLVSCPHSPCHGTKGIMVPCGHSLAGQDWLLQAGRLVRSCSYYGVDEC